MLQDAAYLIEKLDLQPHPEGGYYREVYRSDISVKQEALPNYFKGDRNFATSIYFLLKSGQFSTFHRLQADEIWHFYAGSSISIYVIHPNGELSHLKLGNNPGNGEIFQVMVAAHTWFAAEVNDKDSFALVGCTMAPGFDFADFEMARRHELLKCYPKHQELITRLTIN